MDSGKLNLDALKVEARAATPSKAKPKYWIFAIVTLLAVLLIVTGFVVAFFYMHKISLAAIESNHIKVSFDGKEEMDEKIEHYGDDVYKYTLYLPGGPSVFVMDYSRRTKVMKMDELENQTTCIIFRMDEGDDIARDQPNASKENELRQADVNITHAIYHVDEHPIKNHDLLSEVAREMCQGYPLYWGIVDESRTAPRGHGRVKRFMCDPCRCKSSCRWWSSCNSYCDCCTPHF